MSMYAFAKELRARVAEKVMDNHAEMDRGVSRKEYQQLVGRNKQLDEVLGWITESASAADSEEGEDTL